MDKDSKQIMEMYLGGGMNTVSNDETIDEKSCGDDEYWCPEDKVCKKKEDKIEEAEGSQGYPLGDVTDPMVLDDGQFMEWMNEMAHLRGPGEMPPEWKDRYIQIAVSYAAGDSGEMSWSGVPGQP